MDNSLPGDRSARLTAGLLLALLLPSVFLFYTDAALESVAGWTALIAIPAALGALITHLSDPQGQRSPVGCFVVPTLAILGLTGVAYVFFDEGAICIAMILPLWIPAAIAGALVNRWNARRHRREDDEQAETIFQSSWLALPLFAIAVEQANPANWLPAEVSREVVIAAPADAVWPLLVSIPAIGPDEGRANFTQDVLGVPRPHEAKLERSGAQLVRRATWGKDIHFEERIARMDTGRAISWNFAFPDDSVSRHTDRHISPDGEVLKIQSGGYELHSLADGRTRVRLTTHYRLRSHLAPYLVLWGEKLVGDVEDNVLTIVKQRAERKTR